MQRRTPNPCLITQFFGGLAAIPLRSMAENSFNFARSRGLVRVNQPHQEEEAKLIIEETFGSLDETGNSTTLRASGELEEQIGVGS